MSDVKTENADGATQDAVVETEESREAVAEGETAQDFKSEREEAPSRTSFGDDGITPRLNDGR